MLSSIPFLVVMPILVLLMGLCFAGLVFVIAREQEEIDAILEEWRQDLRKYDTRQRDGQLKGRAAP